MTHLVDSTCSPQTPPPVEENQSSETEYTPDSTLPHRFRFDLAGVHGVATLVAFLGIFCPLLVLVVRLI